MPSRQRGFARKRGGLWLAVWREDRRERSRGGFATKTAALDYANTKADEVFARETAIRFGDPLTQPLAPIGTVSREDHGHERADDRPDLRPPAARLRGLPAGLLDAYDGVRGLNADLGTGG